MSFADIETGFLCDVGCGGGARVIICLFDRREIQQLVFGFKESKPTSTTAMSGAAKRRAGCTSLGPGLKHPPSLR